MNIPPLLKPVQNCAMSPLSSITQRLLRFRKAPMSLQNIMTITMHEDTWGPFYKYGLTLIPTWISNYIHHNMRDRLILLSIMSKKNRGDQINYAVFPITRIKWSTFPVVIHYLVKSPGGNEIFHPWCRKMRKEWVNNWSPFCPGYPCLYLLKILLSPGL